MLEIPRRAPGAEGRLHGTRGPVVTVLHGGPGAPGHMEPVARVLSDAFRVWSLSSDGPAMSR